jgi:hypothetical protein
MVGQLGRWNEHKSESTDEKEEMQIGTNSNHDYVTICHIMSCSWITVLFLSVAEKAQLLQKRSQRIASVRRVRAIFSLYSIFNVQSHRYFVCTAAFNHEFSR